MTDTLPPAALFDTGPPSWTLQPVHAEALLDVVVYGRPAPQGSKRAFRNQHTGRIQQVESSSRVKPWREAVKSAVIDSRDKTRDHFRTLDPVRAHITFTFDKPKSAPKRRRVWPSTRATYDIDKLLRSTFDALTDVFWKDDAQVIEVIARKVYVGDDPRALDWPGAHIVVVPVLGQVT